MQQAVQFWDRIAERYATQPVRDEDAYEQTLDRTRSYLGNSNQLLELGCGTGTTALKLAPDVKWITGHDLSPNMIRIAQEKAANLDIQNVSFTTADVADDALRGAVYDVVTAYNLLHLVEDLDTVLRQVHAAVRKDGLFISKTPCAPDKGAPLKYRLMLLVLPLMQWVGKAPFVKFRTPTELADLMERNGFKVIETGNYPVSPPNHFIVARKTEVKQ